MSFSPDERVQIRKYLGIAEVFHDRDPRVESAMTAVENVGLPSENLIRSYLTKLAALETRIEESLDCIGTSKVNNIESDNVRGLRVLENKGRQWIGVIAHALGMEGPISDFFAAPPTTSGVHPLSHVPPLGGWPS
jgi:hypothetical protein